MLALLSLLQATRDWPGGELADRLGVTPRTVRRDVDLGENLFVAGDHRDTPSTQGALVSGRRAAQAVLARLGAA